MMTKKMMKEKLMSCLHSEEKSTFEDAFILQFFINESNIYAYTSRYCDDAHKYLRN